MSEPFISDHEQKLREILARVQELGARYRTEAAMTSKALQKVPTSERAEFKRGEIIELVKSALRDAEMMRVEPVDPVKGEYLEGLRRVNGSSGQCDEVTVEQREDYTVMRGPWGVATY